MRAIIWKELRENVLWALIGMVVVSLAMVYALELESKQGQSLASNRFLMATMFLGPVLAAAIGFLQITFDARQGYWALLVHRPISRSRLFMGKVLAGLALYFAAMLLPFTASAIWSAMPGHIAGPFRWEVALPGLVDILTGVVYYFAGMIVARRAARWYGSRGLVLVTAIGCSGLVVGIPLLIGALIAIALAGALLFLAARGAFIHNGEYTPQPAPAKASLGLVQLVGIMLVGGMLAAFAGSLAVTRDFRYKNYAVLRDGRVVVQQQLNGNLVSIHDRDGTPLPQFDKPPIDTDELEKIKAPFAWLLLAPPEQFTGQYRRPATAMSLHTYRDRAVYWYFTSDTGRVEGYDTVSRRLIGSFGPSGFVTADQQPTDRFEGELANRWGSVIDGLFTMTSGVYRIDSLHRTVKPVFLPKPGEDVLAAAPFNSSQERRSKRTAIVSGETIHVLDHEDKPLMTFTPEYDAQIYSRLYLYLLDEPNGFGLWYEPLWRRDINVFTLPRYLVTYGSDGQRLAAEEIPAFVRDYRGPSIAEGMLGLVFPPGAAVVAASISTFTVQGRAEFSRMYENRASTASLVVSFLLSAVISLVINLRLARRNAMARSRRIMWATLGLLLGPSGVLLMLCMQTWPARLCCDGCGVARLVSRLNCEHCGAACAPPAPNGTEIFD